MPKRAIASDGRRRAINTKITDAIRAQLEAAAAASDRTVSHEIELRLERSFTDDEQLGDIETKLLGRMVSGAIRARLKQAALDAEWWASPEGRALAREAAIDQIETHLGKSERQRP